MKSIQEHAQEFMRRHNAKSVRGLTLRNGAGDIDATTLGYQYAIDTLTFIKKQITEQKFYQIAPADYIPVVVGEGAFAQSMLTNLVVSASGSFEEGIINQGGGNSRIASVDTGVGTKSVKVANWAKSVDYSIFDIEQALMSGSWDIIEAKHKARKKNWDLGIQEMAFLGSLTDPGVDGLLNQANVNSDTSTITKLISAMSAAEFSTLVKLLIQSFRSNCAYTAYPTDFIIPEDDYNGLAVPVSSTYPNISMIKYLEDAFKVVVPGGVKIHPLVYGMPTFNTSRGVNKHRYVLLNKEPETIRMDIPVDFTTTQPNTLNNFQFQDVAYGQFTGVGVYRNLEVEYFDF